MGLCMSCGEIPGAGGAAPAAAADVLFQAARAKDWIFHHPSSSLSIAPADPLQM